MKNTVLRAAAVLAAVLVLALPLVAQARTRYPDVSGTVTDAAGVLSESLVQDLTELPDRLDDAGINGKLYVVAVDFLDGETAQDYAKALFTRANLGDEDVLLLGAAGEDAYAVTAGQSALRKLGAAKLNDLCVSSGFASQFAGQQYDAAFAAYATAYAAYAGEKYGASVSVTGLFGQTAAAQTDEGSSWSDVYHQVMDTLTQPAQTAPVTQTARTEGVERLTPLGWVVLVVLVMLIFGQNQTARKARKAIGCGCSPLGYVLSMLGLGALIKRKK